MVLTTILTGMLLVPDLDFRDSPRTAVCATYLGYFTATLLAMTLGAAVSGLSLRNTSSRRMTRPSGSATSASACRQPW
ncbi:hypothetical protein [Pseudomonas paeninsulae]|uniref:hypothetical protein n=1 Tax=Pseudomonas paeninsulae TaxID=3110772 RepID=UPI002D796448|nr:hypothetical protein [Pseudomonas sp. IT1137]